MKAVQGIGFESRYNQSENTQGASVALFFGQSLLAQVLVARSPSLPWPRSADIIYDNEVWAGN
mgnify:CR=1 FL=1